MRGVDDAASREDASQQGRQRKSVLLRLDPAVHKALAKWAADDLRSVNAHIEMLLQDALKRSGRGVQAGPLRRPRRPPKGRDPEWTKEVR